LNQGQACWSPSLSRFNFVITYRFGSQQGQSDASSKRSYFALKERDVPYDQQHFVFLKPKQLLLRTIYTTTSMNSTFLTNICVSFLLDPLALKFKQSCIDFKPRNGQVEVPSESTLHPYT
jgi:hypothetical protein